MRRLLLLAVFLLAGCSPPEPAGPLPVFPEDLARSYRDSPMVAGTAYDGQLILLDITWGRRVDDRIVWSLGVAASSLPVIVCEFDGPPPPVGGSLRVIGVCRGRTEDGRRREMSGYVFTIRVTECRLVPILPAQ